jgi:capsid protein
MSAPVVTQADRDAAQALCASGWTHAIEAFARHRTAAEAANAATVAELVEALERLRRSAALLQQNSEGCAQNHYGEDFNLFGMPGFLVDTAADIAAASAILARAKATEQVQP